MSAQNKLAGGWEDSEAKTKKKKKQTQTGDQRSVCGC